jgi:hypothetical protein
MLALRSPFDRLRVPSEVEGLEERSRVRRNAILNVERPCFALSTNSGLRMARPRRSGHRVRGGKRPWPVRFASAELALFISRDQPAGQNSCLPYDNDGKQRSKAGLNHGHPIILVSMICSINWICCGKELLPRELNKYRNLADRQRQSGNHASNHDRNFRLNDHNCLFFSDLRETADHGCELQGEYQKKHADDEWRAEREKLQSSYALIDWIIEDCDHRGRNDHAD